MTLKPGLIERARTVGHVSHASQLRVDGRVQDILARGAALFIITPWTFPMSCSEPSG